MQYFDRIASEKGQFLEQNSRLFTIISLHHFADLQNRKIRTCIKNRKYGKTGSTENRNTGITEKPEVGAVFRIGKRGGEGPQDCLNANLLKNIKLKSFSVKEQNKKLFFEVDIKVHTADLVGAANLPDENQAKDANPKLRTPDSR